VSEYAESTQLASVSEIPYFFEMLGRANVTPVTFMISRICEPAKTANVIGRRVFLNWSRRGESIFTIDRDSRNEEADDQNALVWVSMSLENYVGWSHIYIYAVHPSMLYTP